MINKFVTGVSFTSAYCPCRLPLEQQQSMRKTSLPSALQLLHMYALLKKVHHLPRRKVLRAEIPMQI
jgi:hypothetical protein